MIYKFTCNENNSVYVDQINQHTTTKDLELPKRDSPVGQHLVKYCGTAINIERNVLDLCSGNEKTTKQARHIKKLKRQLNKRDQNGLRELTLKYLFKCKKIDF